MARSDWMKKVEPRCLEIAQKLGCELVEISLDKENTGKYLRIYIDREDGMDLDGCERFHRMVQPLLEDYDYDFLEVSSPGIDRPLKTDRDYDRALGSEVEVHFFRALDGLKEVGGILVDYDGESLTLEVNGDRVRYERSACSLVRPVVDMTGVEDVDLGEDSALKEGEIVS